MMTINENLINFEEIESIAISLFNQIKPLFESEFENPIEELNISHKDMRALGYYCKNQVSIVIPAFHRTLLKLMEDETGAGTLDEIFKFRLIFTITHELGHHMFSLENKKSKTEGRIELFKGLYVNSKNKTKEEIMNSIEIHNLLFNASEYCVNEEIYADNFAYNFIQKHFPEIGEQPYYIKFKKERPNIYKHYTTTKIASSIATRINHLPKDEKIEIAKHYIKTIIKLQNLS